MIKADGGFNKWWHVELDIRNDSILFDWSFNHTSVKEMSLDDAAEYTAKLIAEQYSDLYLLMGGGMDSEFVGNILYQHQIPFTPIIGCVPANNNYDYFFAIHWCEQRGIKPLVVEFDINDMRLQKAHAMVCKNYSIPNNIFFNKAVMDIVIERGGNILLGETNLTYETPGSKWDEPIGDMLEITPQGLFGTIYTQGSHPCEFLAYTPELLLALVKNIDTSLNNALTKTKLYNVPFRPKTWPPRSLTDDVTDKIKKVCKAENFPINVNQLWIKDEFIKLLRKDK